MVGIEEKKQEVTQELAPELKPEDMLSMLYLLITRLGGHVQIEEEVFRAMRQGGNAPIERKYDKERKMWHFMAVGAPKPKRRRGIIKPSRKILPIRNKDLRISI